jgi:FkbM family methyltransferase
VAGHSFRLDETLRRLKLSNEAGLQEVLCSTLRPGDSVFDIGANLGLHTLLAARLVGAGGSVWAFEPVPANLRLLRRNLELNDLLGWVHVVPKAVSNSPSPFLDMAIASGSAETDPTASICTHGVGEASIQVKNVRLDELSLPSEKALRLVKVDVEGAELEVLRGGEQLLQRTQPLLIIEVHGDGLQKLGGSIEDLNAFLERLGYRQRLLEGPSFNMGYYQAVFERRLCAR